MSQLRQGFAQLAEAGAAVALISFATGPILDSYAREMALPFPLLSDPDRRTYDAYGLRSGSTWDIFGPKTIWAYARLLVRGRLPKPVQGDPYQLGADFVIDGRGVIRFAHRGRDPTDRPRLTTLLGAVRASAGPGTAP